MKISVCIPVYNFDVKELVSDLKNEIVNNAIDAEIVLIDDASHENFRQINSETAADELVFLEKNIGRSRIRNLFLNYTKGDYLLFLDCDVKIDNQNFLKNYLEEIDKNSGVEVVYGDFKIDPEYAGTLRNRYSVEKEILSGNTAVGFAALKTVNFVIHRETFKKFQFDEKLIHYGYEDYVFAKKLELHKVKFSAIYNPVVHIDNTSNAIFLEKTETAINSLFQISQDSENENFIKEVKVYKTAKTIYKTGFGKVFLFFYKLFENKIRQNLLSDKPKTKYLDFYKLALLLKKMN